MKYDEAIVFLRRECKQHTLLLTMKDLDISEALISGATLTGVEMALRKSSTLSGTAMNGAVLAASDLLAQQLMGGKRGPVRDFLYGQHQNFTTAGVYALLQEVKRMFGRGAISGSEWRVIFGNLFLALGSAELGRQINAGLGMAPGSVSIVDVASVASGSGVPRVSYDNGSNIDNRGPSPKSRMIHNV